jgi:glycerol-3-phosphate acyltransferase PlsX
MNVGREAGKGTALTREAYEKLKELPLNFVGNLEGSDIVSGYADVIVTDGFSGNILLKSTEAAGKLAMDIVAQAGEGVDPALIAKLRQAIFKKLEFNSQGAATFLGPKKIVVKMHGCANENTTVSAICHALNLDKTGFIEAMSQAL